MKLDQSPPIPPPSETSPVYELRKSGHFAKFLSAIPLRG